MMSFAGQNLFCPSNWLFDMCTNKYQKPNNENGANSNMPSLIQQQLPQAAMLCKAFHIYSRQVTLLTVHGRNTFNYKNSLTKKYLPELIFSLNSRRENDIVILEADLSNKVSYFAKLTIIIFLITLMRNMSIIIIL